MEEKSVTDGADLLIAVDTVVNFRVIHCEIRVRVNIYNKSKHIELKLCPWLKYCVNDSYHRRDYAM